MRALASNMLHQLEKLHEKMNAFFKSKFNYKLTDCTKNMLELYMTNYNCIYCYWKALLLLNLQKLAGETFHTVNRSTAELMEESYQRQNQYPHSLSHTKGLKRYLKTQTPWIENAFISLAQKFGNKLLIKVILLLFQKSNKTVVITILSR